MYVISGFFVDTVYFNLHPNDYEMPDCRSCNLARYESYDNEKF